MDGCGGRHRFLRTFQHFPGNAHAYSESKAEHAHAHQESRAEYAHAHAEPGRARTEREEGGRVCGKQVSRLKSERDDAYNGI